MKTSVLFAVAFILLMGCSTSAKHGGPVPAWHHAMVKKPVRGEGCFKATYPSTKWVPEPCVTPRPPDRSAPLTPGGPKAGSPTPSAMVTSRLISTAIGAFDSVRIPKSNADSTSYTLQLNSQHFDTPLCAGAKVPEQCRGWQQFVYNPTNSGYIQYWLLNYGTTCPGEWIPFLSDCTLFSKKGIPPGYERLADLKDMSLGASASIGGDDVLTLLTLGRVLHAYNPDNILDLAAGWQVAEFGVYGDGNGAELKFAPGATLTVRTTVYNGTEDAPKCTMELLTGETNNLHVVPPCCELGGKSPFILYRLTNERNATFTCPDR